MKRTTIFVDEDIESDLRSIAKQRKQPVSGMIREALRDFVAEQSGAREKRLPRFTGTGRSGRRSTASRHEELLWRDLEPHGKSTRGGPRRA